MTSPLPIDNDYLINTLVDLLNIPSPTGFTQTAIAHCERAMIDLELAPNRSVKGGVFAEWDGKSTDRPRALTAHIDTLGAMVKEIKDTGRLVLTKIGGFAWNTVEGESCSIFTASGQVVRGTLLITKASTHIHAAEVNELKRSDENMEIRLDARTSSADETRTLGIEVGDFISFDPRVEISEHGFIRSRHLDDKAGVACILAAVKAMKESGFQPAQRTTLHISNYEEVGHGAAAGFPSDLVELVVVDMAAVSRGQTSDEFHTTVCAKDSGGPYHIELTNHLRQLAEDTDIPYKMDIYPYYGSDGGAFWRAGGDVQVALIGPGVDASHNYERTHIESLTATTQLIIEYLRS
ncbi:MAG: peptidase M42 [Anaerolineae bacterium SM23_ 63]|nr:MAG: peptidase M42 [Anaerolineae bacterium SM23_ 63]